MSRTSVGQLAGRLTLETIVRSPLVVVADPVVAASGPIPTVEDLDGAGSVLLERPAGSLLVFANPDPDSATNGSVAVVADPDADTALEAAGELAVCSGRLVVGAPDVVAAWGADVDTGDGSAARARVHRGRTRLGLIVIVRTPPGPAALRVGPGAAAVTFPTATGWEAVPLPLAG
jgi:hypothetical protein